MDLKLPEVASDLLEAQKNYDSDAYASCFSETAVVFDEGNEYNGRKEIKAWIEDANQKYKTRKEAVKYSGTESAGLLTAKVSGDFDGSPVLLDYHLELADNKIARLEISLSNA
jgi:ketosteroid isomerase-like protein